MRSETDDNVLELDREEPVVLDADLSIREGAELVRKLKADHPETEVLTRVNRRHLGPRFFLVHTTPFGLSLEPMGTSEAGGASVPEPADAGNAES